MIVVSDTSSLNALHKIGQIALLPALYKQVLIPEQVRDEMLRDSSMRNWLKNFPDWLMVKAIQDQSQYLNMLALMDEGEAEAIVLMIETKADKLLIDDREGRSKAIELRLPVIGTLGVLLNAKQSGLLETIRPQVEALISVAKFRISPVLFDHVLTLAGEF